MEPSKDLFFLAEASPRKIQPQAPRPSSRNLTYFMDSTVRTMRYRAWTRWYHGVYSATGSSSRILFYYFVAAVTSSLWLVIQETCDWSSHWPASSWLKEYKFYLLIIMQLFFIFACLTNPQISHFGLISTLVSHICTFCAGSGIIFSRQNPHAKYPIRILAVAQALIACLAFGMTYFALPVARWYILRSSYVLRCWSSRIVDYSIYTRPSGSVTIVACPFSCQTDNYRLHRWFWICWKSLRFGLTPLQPNTSSLLSRDVLMHEAVCCKYACVYQGQVDDLLRPHGLGSWQQYDDPYGEHLRGCFEFGHPIAPFSSRMNSYGSGFTALRVGWCQFRFDSSAAKLQVYNDSRMQISAEYQNLDEDNFELGLLDVECSIFGKFFRKFPKFIYWNYPRPPRVSLPKRHSPAPAQLGLSNRLSSFSWIEREKALTSSIPKQTLGILSKDTPKNYSESSTSFDSRLDEDDFLSNTRSTTLLSPSGLRCNSHVQREVSLDEDEEDDSLSDMIPLSPKILRSTTPAYLMARHDEETNSIQSINDYTNFLKLATNWVIDRMLPFHIPATPADQRDQFSVTITLDQFGVLRPEKWEKDAHFVAERRRPRLILDEQLAQAGDLYVHSRPCKRRVRMAAQDWALDRPVSPRVGETPMRREIAISGWKRLNTDRPGDLEVLIFIHGYKTKLDEAPVLLGQLIALGGFPNTIKPFMFIWPAGTEVWHYYQARRASQHPLCQRALVAFLKQLAAAGVSNIHILAHSMGSRLFMNSLKFATEEHLFLENFEKNAQADGLTSYDSSESSDRLNLINLVFLHPEHYLDDFVLGGGYEYAQKYASQITIYAHAQDEALASAELLSKGRKCMGRHPFGYVRYKRRDTVRRFPDSGSLSDDYVRSPAAYRSKVRPRSPLGSGSRASIGRSGVGPVGKRKGYNFLSDVEWLDVDVIDCTYLDANVHGLRHCFFNINASVISDLRDLLTSRNRASQRHNTLELRHGNVYTFRTPPVDLISIFGV